MTSSRRSVPWRWAGIAGLLVALAGAGLTAGPAVNISATREGSQIVFRAGGNEMLRYQAEAGEPPRPDIPEYYRRGGYIQSLFSPSGLLLTEDYGRNHEHHHAIWAPWTNTEFEGRKPDFWNLHKQTGTVEFAGLDAVWSKGNHAGLTARHRFVDLEAPGGPKVALNEIWVLRASVMKEPRVAYVIDLTATQTCATDSPLVLPKYLYGGLGFRGNWAWFGVNEGQFLTSNGDTTRKSINETRGRWFWMGGPIEGRTTGTAILCHPSNFRFPQPMRLHPRMPFFCFAPQQSGDMAIEPGHPYVYRFRLIASDGGPNAALIESWWQDYAMEESAGKP